MPGACCCHCLRQVLCVPFPAPLMSLLTSDCRLRQSCCLHDNPWPRLAYLPRPLNCANCGPMPRRIALTSDSLSFVAFSLSLSLAPFPLDPPPLCVSVRSVCLIVCLGDDTHLLLLLLLLPPPFTSSVHSSPLTPFVCISCPWPSVSVTFLFLPPFVLSAVRLANPGFASSPGPLPARRF